MHRPSEACRGLPFGGSVARISRKTGRAALSPTTPIVSMYRSRTHQWSSSPLNLFQSRANFALARARPRSLTFGQFVLLEVEHLERLPGEADGGPRLGEIQLTAAALVAG